MKYVLVEEDDPSYGGIYCLGIYDSVYTAIGYAMTRIWEFGESYKKDGDIFEYSEFDEASGEEVLVCEVRYKHAGEANPSKDYFYILFYEEKEECGRK